MEQINVTITRFLQNSKHSKSEIKPFDPIDIMNNLEGELTGYDCKKCKNKGVIYKRINNFETAIDCECMEIRNAMKLINKSGLKDAFEKCTFESFETDRDYQQDMKKTALKYIKNYEGNWFFVGGQVGSGKTHICTAIVKQFLEKYKMPAKYMQWREEVPKIKALANTPDYDKELNKWKKIKVLYIDDMFKTEQGKSPTTADINLAFELINYRYINNDLITIISSEKTAAEIVGIDESVGSRIYERAKKHCVCVTKDISRNYRLKDLI